MRELRKRVLEVCQREGDPEDRYSQVTCEGVLCRACCQRLIHLQSSHGNSLLWWRRGGLVLLAPAIEEAGAGVERHV
jgi:hypothetical protein